MIVPTRTQVFFYVKRTYCLTFFTSASIILSRPDCSYSPDRTFIPSFIPGLPRHHKLVLGTQSYMSLCDLQATERIRQVHASAIASQKAFSLSYPVLRGKQHQEDCRFRGNHFHHHATDSTVLYCIHEPTTRNLAIPLTSTICICGTNELVSSSLSISP